MKFVIIDTSSILFGFSNRTNIFTKLSDEMPDAKQLISRKILAELQKIGASRKKEARYARTALELMRNYDITVVKSSIYADRWMEKEAIAKNATVITNDTALRRRLKRLGIVALALSKNGSFR